MIPIPRSFVMSASSASGIVVRKTGRPLRTIRPDVSDKSAIVLCSAAVTSLRWVSLFSVGARYPWTPKTVRS